MTGDIKKYFIQQYMQEKYLHGGVGFVDAERIFLSRGFQPVSFPSHNSFSLKAKLSRILFLFKTYFAIKRDSAVFFLFPVYATVNKLLLKWLHKKNVRIVCYIADIDGIKDGDEKELDKEIRFFKRFRNFIVHNSKMRDWLYTNVSDDCNVVMIELFDFPAQPFAGQRHLSSDIVFAGNLAKSVFLEKLYLLSETEPALHFHLYGPGKTDNVLPQKNVTWHGIENPYELPPKLKGSFGLVWEGENIEGSSGSIGHYIRYITHHKLSLYIIAKLPIIIAAPAAMARFVTARKIGFAVNSLYEIAEKIRSVSATEYLEMQRNMEPLAEKLMKGDFLNHAIDEILQLL